MKEFTQFRTSTIPDMDDITKKLAKEKMKKVLCLHGKWQSGPIFYRKIGFLRKRFKNIVEFVCISAPHEITDPVELSALNGKNSGEKVYKWWDTHQIEAPDASKEQFSYDFCGFEASIDAVRSAIKELGPFDGILGFSQGGCLAAVFAIIDESLKFAIIISSFAAAARNSDSLFKSAIASSALQRFPTLHLYGSRDEIIIPSRSIHLADCFSAMKCMSVEEMAHLHSSENCNSFYVETDGGHAVPSSNKILNMIEFFITIVADSTKLKGELPNEFLCNDKAKL